MRRSTLLASAATIAFDAPATAPRVSSSGALEPEPGARAVPGVDAGAVAVLLLGAAIIVSFQSFGTTSFFERHFAASVEGWPKAGMHDYLYWFGSSVAWLFVLPVLIIIAMPARRLRDFGLGLGASGCERQRRCTWSCCRCSPSRRSGRTSSTTTR
jgi:hypothetical protein